MSQNLSNSNPENGPLTLSILTNRIKQSLSANFPDQFWIIAEISEMHVNSSGHAYLELIEKDKENKKILARMRATIWAYTFRMLRPYFEGSTGFQFSDGIKVLINVSLEYHPQYSLSLNIKDIDPSYTLGDLARKKAEIIEKLRQEGIFEMNKQLVLPTVPQRIAVISSPTAAGFEDFLDTLSGNIYNLHFDISLFQAIMQGEKAEESIIQALEKIYEEEDKFDLVVIIRGGGAQIELDCFNNYDLPFHITQFPLPVLTGIGHERDETVTDMVANTRLKTPTAVAEFIIDSMVRFLEHIENAEEILSKLVSDYLQDEKEKISYLSKTLVINTGKNLQIVEKMILNLSYKIASAVRNRLNFSENKIKEKENRIHYLLRAIFNQQDQILMQSRQDLARMTRYLVMKEKDRLRSLGKLTEYSSPDKILSRGFSITLKDGKALKDTKKVKQNDELTTILFKGKIKSKVK